MTKTCERDMFVATLALETRKHASSVADLAHTLIRYATQHKRLCEALCNDPGDWAAKLTKVEKKAREYVKYAMGELGITAEFERDPRAYTFRLSRSQHRDDNYIGVPTR